jgi:hypothetical protein
MVVRARRGRLHVFTDNTEVKVAPDGSTEREVALCDRR